MTPAERSLRGRLGGLTTAARGHVNTAPAREAFLARFEREVDPAGTLSPAERARRADAARRLHMSRLAYRSVRSRSKRKAAPAIESPGAAAPEGHGNVRPAA
jgi:hypothetical protein